jgi:S1-C subfamily serine protease
MVTKFTPRLRAWLLCTLLASAGALAQQPSNEPTPEPAAPAASAPRPVSWGSGFVVAPGYLLTAHHVVREHTRWLVGPVGTTATGRPRWLPAELLKTDPARDLALLRIPETLPALALHPQPNVPIGLEALVIGFPQPRIQGASRKITQGIVNGYRHNEGTQTDQGWLQISAEVSQGNSGGPVLAGDGTVIGMVQRKVNTARVAERTQDTLVNVNYALRSSQLVDFLQDTPAQVTLRPVAVQTVLRPHQIFEATSPSVLAVVGLKGP